MIIAFAVPASLLICAGAIALLCNGSRDAYIMVAIAIATIGGYVSFFQMI